MGDTMKDVISVINNLDYEKERLLQLFDKNIIASNTDIKGIITYASDAFCKISGYKKEELIGKSHSILRHPDMPKDLYKDLWKTILEKKEWKGEVKNLKKDGGYYWVKVTITPLYDSNKNHIGFGAIREDITAQKDVEKLSQDLNQKIKLVELKNYENQQLLKSFDKNIITSKTDLRGVVTYVSEAFCKISGYEKEELLGLTHNVVRHSDMPKELFTDLWNTLLRKETWHGEIKNRTKDGGYYWVDAIISPLYSSDGEHIGYSALRYDITDKKAVEQMSLKLEKNKKFLDDVLDSQEQIVITTDGQSIVSLNQTFLEVFGFEDKMDFLIDYECICDLFYEEDGFLRKFMGEKTWIEYILENQNQIHKVKFKINNEFKIFSVTAGNLTNDESSNIKSAVFTDITELENIKNDIEAMNRLMKESIEYASLIQKSIIPLNKDIHGFFENHFVIWEPKDIVGGDIYLFERINDYEALLLVIDCTGHGVAGAFLTMLIKAVERQIITNIITKKEKINTSNILKEFIDSMKFLLRQNSIDRDINVGFDGAVMHINKKDNLIKFSSCEVPMFYVDHNMHVNKIKPDRNTIITKSKDNSYKFQERIIPIVGNMKFYITTDGFIDQNGGTKSFPLGKKKFVDIIEKSKFLKVSEQENVFLSELKLYQGNENRNDDITLICLEINQQTDKNEFSYDYEI